jgi:DNA-binding Lrp family transcriptional regulator
LVTAIVLIQVERHLVPETAEAMIDFTGVSEVYSVAGEWDLVAIVRVKEHEQLAEVISNKMLKMPGIMKTQTLVAFKSYARGDLERMWQIGMEEES